MTFAAPIWLLVVLPILAGLAAFRIFAGRQAQRALETAFHTPLLERLRQSVDRRRRRIKAGLVLLGVLALGLGLARPRWGQSEISVERTGADLVVALDVSRSMLAADADGTNRLAAATQALRRLLATLEGDRVGLVLFAGEAFVAVPLTRDYTVVERMLDAASPAAISEPGSNLGEAIPRARDCLRAGGRGPCALLIVSDGEQLQGDAAGAAQGAAAAGLRVHTAGVGSAAGALVPSRTADAGGFARNLFGRDVRSHRDETQLQRIAAAGGGRYTRLEGKDSRLLPAWFREVAATLPQTTEKRRVQEPRERFQWPLAAALVFLGVEWLLSDRRSARPKGGAV